MYRSLHEIERHLASSQENPFSSGKENSVTRVVSEYLQFQKFWGEVKWLVAPRSLEAINARVPEFNSFFGTTQLSFNDAWIVRSLFQELLSLSSDVDDADEGIRVLGDFIRREEGLSAPRKIIVSEGEPHVSPPGGYDNVNFTDGSIDIEASLFEFIGLDPIDDFDVPSGGALRWQSQVEEQFRDIESLRRALAPVAVQQSSMNNLLDAVKPYFDFGRFAYRPGLLAAISTPMRYLVRRSRLHPHNDKILSRSLETDAALFA